MFPEVSLISPGVKGTGIICIFSLDFPNITVLLIIVLLSTEAKSSPALTHLPSAGR